MKKKLSDETKARENAEKLRGAADTSLTNVQRNERHLQKEQAEAMQIVVNSFLHLLTGVGDETEPPERKGSVLEAIRWSGKGLDTFWDLLVVGREYSALETLRAYVKTLRDAGCDHIGQAQPGDACSYWVIDQEAHESAVHFFDTFWRGGGRDLALYRATLSRSQVSNTLAICSSCFAWVWLENLKRFSW